MASIVVCERLRNSISRVQLQDINLTENISNFKCALARQVDFPVFEIELIYCGQSLDDGRTLDSYGIKSGSTVYALHKAQSDVAESTPAPLDQSAVQQVCVALKAALHNADCRQMLQDMLSNPDSLEAIVAATPSLQADPVAFAMLQTPELLTILTDKNYMHKVLEKHPSLGHAAVYIASAVNQEGTRSSNVRSASETYSLDQMSDDEELMPGGGAGGSRGRSVPSEPITTSQLAAALAIAGGDTQDGAASSQPQASSSEISADFLRQAMMQVTNPSSSSSRPPPASHASLQAQVEQLRAMGITDEEAARHALEATGGDINAALHILFGDGI